jgi:bifunctional enzyme CysN/CysC
MTEAALLPGKLYDFKLGGKTVSGRVTAFKHRIDVNTLQEIPAPGLELNEIGLCEISVDQPVCVDSYERNRGTGGFIVIDRLTNVTVGAGMINLEIAAANRQVRRSSTIQVTKEERSARYGQKPVTIMFIGVSGSGKSTLAHGLERRLFDMGRVSTVLDGKAMRLGISKDLPHDAQGRAENLRRSAHIARMLNDSGLICCAAFVAPNPESREHALSVIGKDNCVVIYLNPPMEVCKQRDPSGIYAAAQATSSADVPGLSFPYPRPEHVDIELDTSALTVEDCLDEVISMMQSKAFIARR